MNTLNYARDVTGRKSGRFIGDYISFVLDKITAGFTVTDHKLYTASYSLARDDDQAKIFKDVIVAIASVECTIPCKLIDDQPPSVYYASHLAESMKLDTDCNAMDPSEIRRRLDLTLGYSRWSYKNSMRYIHRSFYQKTINVNKYSLQYNEDKIRLEVPTGFWFLDYNSEYDRIIISLYPNTLIPLGNG